MAVTDVLELSALRSVRGKLSKLQRPAVALQATAAEDASIKVGGSKLGGAPDLPAGTPWPTAKLPLPRKHGTITDYLGQRVLPDDGTIALPLIAQIALADVAKHTSLLPAQGLLSVFFDHTAWCERNKAKRKVTFLELLHPARVRVIHTPSTKGLVRLVPPPAVPMIHAAQKLRAAAESTLPSYESAWFAQGGPFSNPKTQIKLTAAQHKAYVDEMYETYANRPLHRLLGHAHYVQPYGLEGSYKTAHPTLFPDEKKLPAKGPALVAACQDSQLLFQTKGNFAFGRGGNLMFFIRNADLAAGDFSRVWVATQ